MANENLVNCLALTVFRAVMLAMWCDEWRREGFGADTQKSNRCLHHAMAFGNLLLKVVLKQVLSHAHSALCTGENNALPTLHSQHAGHNRAATLAAAAQPIYHLL